MADAVLKEDIARAWHEWVRERIMGYARVAQNMRYEIGAAAVLNDIHKLEKRIYDLEGMVRKRDQLISQLRAVEKKCLESNHS